MKVTQKTENLIFIILALCWIVIFVLGITNHSEVGFYVAVVLEVLYCFFGCVHKGKVKKKSFIYPLVIWGVMMLLCVTGLWYWQLSFGNAMPTFTILGMHPSFAMIVLLFWIGSVLCWSVGLWVNRKDWLSDEEWNEFLAEVETIKKEENNG